MNINSRRKRIWLELGYVSPDSVAIVGFVGLIFPLIQWKNRYIGNGAGIERTYQYETTA